MGCFPLIIDFLTHSIKYWSNISKIEPNSLVHHCYLDCYKSCQNNENWLSYIKLLLNSFNFTQTWENQGSTNTHKFVTQFKNVLGNTYIEKWTLHMDTVTQENKLRTYVKLKHKFEMEHYLISVKNLSARSAMTKLRISAHDLNIETGRYSKPRKTPLNLRKCTLCKSDSVEDEAHFLLYCDYFSVERKQLFESLVFLSCKIEELDEINKLKFLLSSDDIEINNITAKFILNCFKKRGNRVQLSK